MLTQLDVALVRQAALVTLVGLLVAVGLHVFAQGGFYLMKEGE